MGRPLGSKNKPKIPPPIVVEQPAAPPVVPPISIPPVAWTRDQWEASPSVQAQLQRYLDDPIMRMAFQSLLVTALPCSKATVVPGVSADAITLHDSQRLHNRSGFVGFYKALHNLARFKETPPPKGGWGIQNLLEEDE